MKKSGKKPDSSGSQKKPGVSTSGKINRNKYKRIKGIVHRLQKDSVLVTKLLTSNFFQYKKKSNELHERVVEKYFEERYEYVLIHEIPTEVKSELKLYDSYLKIKTNKLIKIASTSLYAFYFSFADLALPVRLSVLQKNLKFHRVPKHVLYMLVLFSSSINQHTHLLKDVTLEIKQKMFDYVLEKIYKNQFKPKPIYIWLKASVVRYMSKLSGGAKFSKLFEIATREAVILKLNRVDELMHVATDKRKCVLEYKRRLWWMIYQFCCFETKFNGDVLKCGQVDVLPHPPSNENIWSFGTEAYGDDVEANSLKCSLLIPKIQSRQIETNIHHIKISLLKIQISASHYLSRRERCLKKDPSRNLKQFISIEQRINNVVIDVQKMISTNIKNLNLLEHSYIQYMDITRVQKMVVEMWYRFIEIKETRLMMAISDVAHCEKLADQPWRVLLSKKLCIGNALDIINCFKWGFYNIPTQYWDFRILFVLVKVGVVLINVASIEDYPKINLVNDGLNFVTAIIEKRAVSDSSINFCLLVLSYVLQIKTALVKTNSDTKKVSSIPIKISITTGDIYPWFLPLTTSLSSYFCCVVSYFANINKMLSFNFYAELNLSEIIDPSNGSTNLSHFEDLSKISTTSTKEKEELGFNLFKYNYKNLADKDNGKMPQLNKNTFKNIKPRILGKLTLEQSQLIYTNFNSPVTLYAAMFSLFNMLSIQFNDHNSTPL